MGFNSRLRHIVWAKETNAVEVNKMRRIARTPNLGFPCYDSKKPPEDIAAVWERGHIDNTRF